jgi:DNA-binding MarR family transcriptional regulator
MSTSPQQIDPAVRSERAQPPSASDVIAALASTTHAVHRFADTRIAQADLPAKLSGSRLRVLITVAHTGRMRMGDLAAALGVAARTVTDLVDGLEREGLLLRRPDPTDGRATLLELSPIALAHFERVQALQGALSEEILALLNADQRRQLVDLLTRVRAAVGEPDSCPPCDDE